MTGKWTEIKVQLTVIAVLEEVRLQAFKIIILWSPQLLKMRFRGSFCMYDVWWNTTEMLTNSPTDGSWTIIFLSKFAFFRHKFILNQELIEKYDVVPWWTRIIATWLSSKSSNFRLFFTLLHHQLVFCDFTAWCPWPSFGIQLLRAHTFSPWHKTGAFT